MFAAGVLMAVGAALFHWQTALELDALDQKMSKVRRSAGWQAGAVKKAVLSGSEKQEMDEVVQKLSLPWDRFFEAIEKAANTDVVLLSLQPEVKRGQVRIGGEARDKYAMLQYVSDLQEGGYFSEVKLLEHEVNERDADKPVRFMVSARWQN